jgi:FkbM family methyltransferase
MASRVRQLADRLLWLPKYPVFREAPGRFVARAVGFTLREKFASTGDVEFATDDGHVFVSPPDNISSFIAGVFGQRDLHVYRFWQRYLRQGAVFLDVGANIGLYGVPAGAVVGPRGTVICFEANPATHRYLVHNLARNRRANVMAENLAVGAESGEIRIATGARNAGEVHVATEVEEGEVVPMVSLDTYCAAHDLDRVDYIKIDVEGFGASVLAGARRIIAENADILVQTEYEPAHLARYGDPDALARLLDAQGLKPFALAWTDGSAAAIETLDGYRGEILWSRRDLAGAPASAVHGRGRSGRLDRVPAGVE